MATTPNVLDLAVGRALGAPQAGAPTGDVLDAAISNALGKKPPPAPETPPVTETERAMQQGMGGPPMFVDVPKGQKQTFEQAGQRGYRIGAAAGAGAVSLAALGGAGVSAAPGAVATVGELAAAHPVAAAVIKTLVRGGLLKAGWEGARLLGKIGGIGFEQ